MGRKPDRSHVKSNSKPRQRRRRPHLTAEQRWQILCEVNQKHAASDAKARKLVIKDVCIAYKVDKSTVSRILAQANRQNGSITLATKPRCGRPKKIDDNADADL